MTSKQHSILWTAFSFLKHPSPLAFWTTPLLVLFSLTDPTALAHCGLIPIQPLNVEALQGLSWAPFCLPVAFFPSPMSSAIYGNVLTHRSLAQLLINTTNSISPKLMFFPQEKGDKRKGKEEKRRERKRRRKKGKWRGKGKTSKPRFLCSIPVTVNMTTIHPGPQATYLEILFNTFFSPSPDSTQSPICSFCLQNASTSLYHYSITLVPKQGDNYHYFVPRMIASSLPKPSSLHSKPTLLTSFNSFSLFFFFF